MNQFLHRMLDIIEEIKEILICFAEAAGYLTRGKVGPGSRNQIDSSTMSLAGFMNDMILTLQ